MTVADLFRNNNISSFPPISEDYDIFSANAVKGYFLYAMEDYFSDYEASYDCDSINYFRDVFYFSDFIGFFESLVICLEQYRPEQAEAKFYMFNALKD